MIEVVGDSMESTTLLSTVVRKTRPFRHLPGFLGGQLYVYEWQDVLLCGVMGKRMALGGDPSEVRKA